MENLSKYLSNGFLYKLALEGEDTVDLSDVYVSVLKLYLLEYFNVEETKELLKYLERISLSVKTSMREECIADFCALFFKYLKRNLFFRNFDELLNLIGFIKVEKWIVEYYTKLVLLFPNFYIYKNIIFYCDRKEEESHLCCTLCENLGHIDRYFMDFGQYEAIRPRKILENIDELLGHNQNYLFLRKTNLRDAFICYDISTEESKVIYCEYIGNIDGNPIVLKDKRKIGILHEKGRIQWIGNLEKYKQIGVFNGKILEEGKCPCFYAPKFWNMEGNVSDPDELFSRTYILGKLILGIDDESTWQDLWQPLSKSHFESLQDVPEILSMNTIIAFFHKKYSQMKLCRNQSYIMMEQCFSILERYFSKEEDITEILYLLLHISARMDKNNKLIFTQKFYEYMKMFSEMEEYQSQSEGERTKKFFSLMERIKEVPMFWSDEVIKNLLTESEPKGPFVGYFTIKGKEIYFEKISLIQAKCFGSYRMLMPKSTENKGFVMYDMENDKFIIQYYKSISERVVKKIKESYKLEKYRVQVQI